MTSIATEALRGETGTRDYKSGETIFREGEAGSTMYIVLEGTVRLSVTGRNLEKVIKGGVFGEMALIDEAPRSATAVAASDCKLLPLSAERFKKMIRDNPDFALQIMAVMAGRLRSMDRRL